MSVSPGTCRCLVSPPSLSARYSSGTTAEFRIWLRPPAQIAFSSSVLRIQMFGRQRTRTCEFSGRRAGNLSDLQIETVEAALAGLRLASSTANVARASGGAVLSAIASYYSRERASAEDSGLQTACCDRVATGLATYRIAARKLLMPFPGALDNRVERLELRLPAKFLLDSL